MAETKAITFDLKSLYQKSFGGVALPFPAGGIPDPRNLLPIKSFDPSLLGLDVENNNEPKKVNGKDAAISILGAAIHLPVSIAIPGQTPYQLPNEPIVSIEAGKEIIVTSLNRGKKRGTVKEEINLDDYRINIRGIIINEEENEYPEDIVRNMRTILENPGVIKIDTLTTRIFNISLAVVKSFRFPRDFDTKLRWCYYEIDLISDEDFELELIK